MPMPMHINLSYMYARVYAIYCAGLISDCKSEEEGHAAIMDLSWTHDDSNGWMSDSLSLRERRSPVRICCSTCDRAVDAQMQGWHAAWC